MKMGKRTYIIGILFLLLAVAAGGSYLGAFPTIPKPESPGGGAVSWDLKLGNPFVEKGEDRELLLNIRIKGKEATITERAPVNLVLVMDRSGSMGDRGKIEYAREAAKQMIGGLSSEDRLAVVAYSTDVDVMYPIQKLRDKETVSTVVNRIYPTNSTNLSGGLVEGIAQLQSVNREGYVNRVILLSDGLANEGITSVSELSKIASSAAAKGIYVTAMGLGADYDENLMTNLAEYGAGNYYFIESPGQLAEIFEREFGRIAATVAKNPVIRLALSDGVTVKEVYGYTYTTGRDGSVEIRPGDFFGGQERDILVRLNVPAGAEGKSTLVSVNFDYQDLLNNGTDVNLSEALSYDVTADRDKVAANENRDVTARWISVDSAVEYYRAASAYESGNRNDALSRIKAAYQRMKELNSSPYATERTEMQEAELREALDDLSAAPASPESDEAKLLIKQQKAGAREQQK